jgi:methionine-rich copper-binding protein CopC
MVRRVPLAAAALVFLLTLAATLPVLGHADLASSDPASGSTVTDVQAVRLLFTEALNQNESSFKLQGPDGSTVGTGAPVGPRRIALTGLSLAPGTYTVKWTSVATDGHVERGKFTFDVAAAAATQDPAAPVPTATAEATPAATAAPTATDQLAGTPAATAEASGAPPAVSASPVPVPSASPEPAQTAGVGTDVLLPIAAGLALVAIVGALVLRRSRQA